MTIRQNPFNFGLKRSRWRLQDLLVQFKSWMKVETIQGVWYVLKSLEISYKRTRLHVHSPDVHYEEKVQLVLKSITFYIPNRQVVLFQDECTIYSKPSQSYDYELVRHEPKAELGYRSEQLFRLIATLDVYTGRVVYLIRPMIRVPTLIDFYEHLTKTYENQKIYLIQDNSMTHWHPSVRAALMPQDQQFCQFPVNLPPSWADVKPKKKYLEMNLNIQTVHLPTYASWLNPIEKLWRKFKQEIIHKHPFTDDVKELKLNTIEFLDQFKDGSRDILNYVGLFNDFQKENFFSQVINPIFNTFGMPKVWDG